MNCGCMSIKIPFFNKQTQTQWQSIRYDDLGQERSSSKAGWVALLPWKPLFCPFPSCLAFLYTMRWKANCLFDKVDWSGVWKRRGWRLGRLKDAQELKKHARKRPSGAGTAGVCSLTGHFVFSGLHVTWYQVDRFYLWLPAAPSQTAEYLKSEEITNTH